MHQFRYLIMSFLPNLSITEKMLAIQWTHMRLVGFISDMILTPSKNLLCREVLSEMKSVSGSVCIRSDNDDFWLDIDYTSRPKKSEFRVNDFIIIFQ
jgi:hypothetical protein